jgi:hypothetical protein
MTARKHFKQFVRSRMAKTRESYTTARRHVIRQTEVPGDGRARWHLPGNIPAAAALRILLTAADVRDPRNSQPLSEALVFGIAGGIGIGIASFRYEKEDFSSFYIAGRHLWQDDVAYVKAALARFGIEPAVRETAGTRAADKHLREALAAGTPCLAWVDMTHLPHRGLPPQMSGGGYHLVTVYEIDDSRGVAQIGDLADEPIDIKLTDLAIARGRIKSFKNRLLSIPPVKDTPRDLPTIVRAGLRACVAGFTGKPAKGPATMSSFQALERWAECLSGSTHKESWERLFPRGQHLWQGLNYVHDYIENYHTGGGLCRPIFAECLVEAAELPGLEGLGPVNERYAKLGTQWSELAAAALPDHVSVFREARELYARRAELRAEGKAENIAQIKAVWTRLGELKDRAREQFPLPEAQCTKLLASLQERVKGLHQAEVAAHAALAMALA